MELTEEENLIQLKKKSKELIQLNINYHNWMYLHSFDCINKEKNRLMNSFGYIL